MPVGSVVNVDLCNLHLRLQKTWYSVHESQLASNVAIFFYKVFIIFQF